MKKKSLGRERKNWQWEVVLEIICFPFIFLTFRICDNIFGG